MTTPDVPEVPAVAEAVASRTGTGRGAMLVAAGILLSRIAGLIRQSVFAHFFGTTAPGDAFNAAFRIPNLLQNLLGEGVLSASLIPEYAGLRAQGRHAEAARLAATAGATLALISALIVLLGELFAPQLVALIAGGFSEDTRALTISLVRILFPGAALLVFSAWCLAVLNSHGRFFLSYAAPVLWNFAMIATLLLFGASSSKVRLAELLAWGSVIGSALQFVVQLPWVIPPLRAAWGRAAGVPGALRRVARNFGPVVIGRGVVQISAYIDTRIASSVAVGAVSAVMYAQMLYLLPVSLFGMSVSAAELPAMAGVTGGDEEVRAGIRGRVTAGLRQIAFFVVPSSVALIVLGDVIVGALYQRGNFDPSDTVWVWQIVAAAGVGLVGSTLSRLYSSAFYAMRDTRTPLKFAIARILLSAALGYVLAIPVPRMLGLDPRLGAAGLTLAGAVGAWTEFALLRGALQSRVGVARVGGGHLAMLFAIAGSAALVATLVKVSLTGAHPLIVGVTVLPVFAIVYLVGARAMGVEQARALRLKGMRR